MGENDVFAEVNPITKEIIKKAPKDLNSKTFTVVEQSENSITVGGLMHIKNVKGFDFYVDLKREITLLDSENIASNLDISLDNDLGIVAYRAETAMTNVGNEN